MGTFNATFQTDNRLNANFLSTNEFSSSFDHAIIPRTPSINDVPLIGNKTSAEIKVLDAPDEAGKTNAILKNVFGGKPKWAFAAFVAESEGSESVNGQTIISAGSTEDSHTSGGRVGMFRLLRATGNNIAKVLMYAEAPTNAYSKSFIFGNHTPASNAYVVSSSKTENAAGALAKFEDGLSVIAGSLIEDEVEVNTNKVTSVSAQSTDVQYPSAKCVYDAIDNATESISDAEIDAICI